MATKTKATTSKVAPAAAITGQGNPGIASPVASNLLALLKYVVQNRYLTIDAGTQPQLESAFGVSFSKYFQTGLEIKVKPSTFEGLTHDQQVALVSGLTKLTQEIGANPFEIKQTLVPTEALDQERVMDPGVEALFGQACDAGMVAPIKPTFKELGK